MGCGSSTLTPDVRDQMKKEAAHSKQIDQTNMKDHQDEMTVAKLLFLGPGESGKSTLLKQMNYLYGVGYDDEKRAGFKEYIYDNIFEGISTLITFSDRLLERGINSKISAEHEASKQFFMRLMDERSQQRFPEKGSGEPAAKKMVKQFVVDEEVAKHIEALWKDPGVQLAFENRALFQLPDSVPYYFDKIREIGKPDYLPTDADVLRTRVRSTGVFQATFCVKNLTFRVFDVGGQRNERKKWIHCFDNVVSTFHFPVCLVPRVTFSRLCFFFSARLLWGDRVRTPLRRSACVAAFGVFPTLMFISLVLLCCASHICSLGYKGCETMAHDQ